MKRNGARGNDSAHIYVDYINFYVPQPGSFNGALEFDSEEDKSYVFGLSDVEYLDEYEGATGVVKGRYTDDWTGIQFRVDALQEQLTQIEWDYVELKIAVDFEGSRTSWDGMYSNSAGWTYTTQGVWRIYKASKAGIIKQFGTLDNFYKAITVGTGSNDGSRLFVLWNMCDHGNFYFDYFKLCADNFDRVMDFETEDEIAFLRSGTDAQWLESSTCDKGVTENGVISYYHGTTEYAGVKFQFNNYTGMTLSDWDKIEIRIRIIRGSSSSSPNTDASFGSFFIGNTGVSIGNISNGWSTLTITKQQIEDSDAYSAESFWTAFTSEEGAKLFWCWSVWDSADWTIQISSISLLKA